MKTFKKSLAVVLAVLMMLSMMIVGGISTNAAEYGTDSVTFKAGETIYYDLTQYGGGANIYNAAGNEFGAWQENNASIVAVTLTKDLKITASSNLFKSGANGWNGVTANIPTEGQNMIVSTDGKTAHWDTYVEPEKVESTVYFKNTVGWTNVYFYGGVYWDDSKGSGSDGIAVGPVAMTKVDGTDDLYTCTVNAPAFTKVAFTKDSQKGYGNFHQTEAVYSADFNSATPLFTPDASATSTLNSTKYYGGSWSTYSVEPTETSATTESTQATTASTEATQPTTQPASEPADTVTLYCKCAQEWWKKDGAAVGVYYWSDSSQPIKWPGVRGKAVEGETDLWQFEVPADMPNIIFSRVNGSGDIADWGAQTATLSMPTDGTNLYTITSTDATWGSKPGVTGEWSVYGAEPVETDYTVVFNYVTEDGTQTLTKTTTSAESDVTKIATSVMPNIENKMYSYALGECTADGTTITANLVETKKLYSVTVDGTIMETQFGYKDKATVTLKDGTEYTFYVTGDVEITSDDPKVAAALSLDAVTVTDTKVSMDLLATANVEKFARMGVAFATAEKTVDEIAAAVANVTTGTAASNGVAVHNSTVDTPNESGSYQFTYAPYVSKDKADKTLYFYTFAVDTDGNVSVSSVVSVDLANAVA